MTAAAIRWATPPSRRRRRRSAASSVPRTSSSAGVETSSWCSCRRWSGRKRKPASALSNAASPSACCRSGKSSPSGSPGGSPSSAAGPPSRRRSPSPTPRCMSAAPPAAPPPIPSRTGKPVLRSPGFLSPRRNPPTMRLPRHVAPLLLVLVSTLAAPAANSANAANTAAGSPADPYPSTYKPRPARPVLITHATVLTAVGDRIEDGSVLLRDGKIAGVGHALPVPADTLTVDAKGKWVTPGLIDAHSHLGVYPSPEVPGNSDGNEITDPITADMWSLHSIWPQDPQFPLALAGGVTSQLILPGSANLIGGRGVTVKTVPGRSAMDMRFPGAPWVLKMACGENPKRVYGAKGRSPATRMGNIAVTREAWIKARDYEKKWNAYQGKLNA